MREHVTVSCIGRFHQFHLARQLESHGLLTRVWSGYPKRQLRDETGIPADKLCTYPWIQAPYMAAGRFNVPLPHSLMQRWRSVAQFNFDDHVVRSIRAPTTLIALSGNGLHSGMRSIELGGRYICDRGSAHIRYQQRILEEELELWGLRRNIVDAPMLEREEQEYATAQFVSVPSSFAARSFVSEGIVRDKLFVNPYGVRVERFRPAGEPDPKRFTVIFVGIASLRKGFLYLIDAFQRLKISGKRLRVIGQVASELQPLLKNFDLNGVEFLGPVSNAELPRYYSEAHAMVLPSIEDGFGMVIGEAMACGCPVIASQHTGADDFYDDGVEGFIVPIRSPDAIAARLTELADSPAKRAEMSQASLSRVKSVGGWDAYGDRWKQFLQAPLR